MKVALNDKFDNCILKKLSFYKIKKIEDLITAHLEIDKSSNEAYIQSVAKMIEYYGTNISSESNLSENEVEGTESVKVFSSVAYSNAVFLVGFLSPIFKDFDIAIYGQEDEEKIKIANEKKEIFEYLLKNENDFYYRMENILLWAITGGVGFAKVAFDHKTNFPKTTVIQPQNLILNKAYTSIDDASIVSEIQEISIADFIDLCNQKVFSKINFDLENIDYFSDNDIENVLLGIAGRENKKNDQYDKTSLKTVKLVITYFDFIFEEDNFARSKTVPYKAISLWQNGQIKLIRLDRNWINGDKEYSKKETIISYGALPALTGVGYGLVHYGLKNAIASTNILNQILIQSRDANITTGFIGSDIAAQGITLNLEHLSFTPVKNLDGNISQKIHEIRATPPDETLFKTKEMLENNINDITFASINKLLQLPANAPASTTMMILDKESKPLVMLAERIKESFSKHLKAYNNLLFNSFDDENQSVIDLPKKTIQLVKKHFDPAIRIYPSAETILKNSSYRFLLADLILKNAQVFPDLHDTRKTLELFYETVGLSKDIIKILLPENDNEIPSEDPLTENKKILNGEPVKVYPFQDDDAHIIVHADIQNTQGVSPEVMAELQAHIQEHIANKYYKETLKNTKIDMPDDISSLDEKQQNKLAVKIAEKIEKNKKTKNADGEEVPELSEAQLLLQEVKIRQGELQVYAKSQEHKLGIEKDKLQIGIMKLDLDKQKMILDQQKNEILRLKEENEAKIKLIESNNKFTIEQEKNDISKQNQNFEEKQKQLLELQDKIDEKLNLLMQFMQNSSTNPDVYNNIINEE